MTADDQTSRILNSLYPDFRNRCIRVEMSMVRLGLPMNIIEGNRSFSRQSKLPKSATNAGPGMSLHHYGIAADWCFATEEDPFLTKAFHSEDEEKRRLALVTWKRFGVVCQKNGLRWGADWNSDGNTEDEKLKDFGHCEMRYAGVAPSDLKREFLRGKMAAVWRMLDIARGAPFGEDWKDMVLFDPSKEVNQ